MKVTSIKEAIADCDADAVVVGVWDAEPVSGAAAELDDVTNGLLSRLIEQEEISASACSVSTLLAIDALSSPIVAVVGLGKRDEAQASLPFRAAASAAKHLATRQRDKVAFYLDIENRERAICGAIVGCQGQDIMRKELKLFPFAEKEPEEPQGDLRGERDYRNAEKEKLDRLIKKIEANVTPSH